MIERVWARVQMEPEPESQVFLVNASSQQSGKDGAPAEKGAPPDREALDDWSSPLIRPSDYFPGYALGGHKIVLVSPSRRSRICGRSFSDAAKHAVFHPRVDGPVLSTAHAM